MSPKPVDTRTHPHHLADLIDDFRRRHPLTGKSLMQALRELQLVPQDTLERLPLEHPELLGRRCGELVARGVLTRQVLQLALGRMAGLPEGQQLDLQAVPFALLDLLFPPHPPAVAWPAPATSLDALEAAIDTIRGQPLRTLREAIEELHLLEPGHLDRLQTEDPLLLRERGPLLVRRGLLTEDEFGRAMARVIGVPEIDARGFDLADDALRLLPLDRARAHGVLPLGMRRDRLLVACCNPGGDDLDRHIADETGHSVLLVWGGEAAINQRLDDLEKHGAAASSPILTVDWKPPAPAGEQRLETTEAATSLPELVEQASAEMTHVTDPEEPLGAVGDESGMARLVRRLLLDAKAKGASDVHLEMSAEGTPQVRMRIDGDLQPWGSLPPLLRPSLVSRIKVMARLDIAEHRRPQDGKIALKLPDGAKLEVRVAVLPTHDGMENVVLRLLGSAQPLPLARLGFQAAQGEVLQRMAHRSVGLLLVAGPTGSGKTTTLHSLLRELNTPDRKIWTVEDPIEITQPGLNQVQVNPKIDLTFANAMRSFLRADPDVIMVGEIRDAETAQVALDASLTGHLVLSTLHTNNVGESVLRLLEIGLEPMNFADALLGVVAQRLVRALCPHCARREPLTSQQWDQLLDEYAANGMLPLDEARARLLAAAGVDDPRELTQSVPCGCDQCGGKGTKGRMGIYEVMENTGPLPALVRARAPASEILQAAVAQGMRTLRHDALEKMVQGKIDWGQARAAYL